MTDTHTPQMTPEQRADLVTHYTRGKWFIWNGGADCPVPLGTRLEIVGGFDDTWTTVAEEGSIFWPNVAAFRIDPPTSKLTAERDAAQAELSSKEDIIARLTAALATPDQIAALAADRAATVTVKPLVWVQSHLASWNDDWHTVPTAYSIRYADENGWKWSTCSGFGYCHSAEAAKAAAQADYDARIRSAITITSGASPNHIPLPRAEVVALMEAADAVDDEYCGQNWGPKLDTIDDLRKALATLQERMK